MERVVANVPRVKHLAVRLTVGGSGFWRLNGLFIGPTHSAVGLTLGTGVGVFEVGLFGGAGHTRCQNGLTTIGC